MCRVTFCLSLAIAAQGQSFEVASIRPHPPAVDQPLIKRWDADALGISGNRVALTMASLKELVMAAYNEKEYQVSGVPGWASRIDCTYDITAKTPGDVGPAEPQVRRMLQSLLAERFHLQLRRESKQLPVYNLVIAKGGPKLQPASAAPPPAGFRRGSLDQIAALLSLMMDRPVLDRTGLPGIYDYPNELALLDTGARDPAETVGRVLETLHDQLGLRAQPARAQIQLLVIERAEKPSAD